MKKSNQSLIDLHGHTQTVLSANYSPDGKRIVTASYDDTARIWYAEPWKIEDYPGYDSMPFIQRYNLWRVKQKEGVEKVLNQLKSQRSTLAAVTNRINQTSHNLTIVRNLHGHKSRKQR